MADKAKVITDRALHQSESPVSGWHSEPSGAYGGEELFQHSTLIPEKPEES